MSVRKRAHELRFPFAVLAVAAALHVALSAYLTPPGHLTWDAGTYHLMVKALHDRHSLTIDNGYAELPSPELVVGQLQVANGKLVSQYPDLFAIVALPFYALFGFRGLYVLSALAFVATCAVVLDLGERLFSKRRVGVVAVAVYALGTFAWEYSQWPYPHALATLGVAVAFALAVVAAERERGFGLALLAGLVAGAGCGIRLDSVLAVPAVLAAPVVLARSRQAQRVASTLLGVLAGLSGPAATSLVKFGSPNPFSYGSRNVELSAGVGYHLPLVWLGLLGALIGAGAFTLGRWRSARAGALFALGGLSAAAAFVPGFVAASAQLAQGGYQLVVDLRARPLYPSEPGLVRSASGALLYLGALKKSLIQSLPYLPAALILCAGAPAHLRRALGVSLLVPAAYLLFYGYDGWHGSVALNLRYLTPALPFLALLTGYAFETLWSSSAGDHWRALLGERATLAVFALVLVGGTFGLRFAKPSGVVAERLLLTAPLVLALLLALASLPVSLGRAGPRLKRLVALGLGAGAGWAGATCFGYDYPATTAHQRRHLEIARALAPSVPPRSVVLSDDTDLLWGLVDRVDGVVIGRAETDFYASLGPLVRAMRSRGRRTYLAYEEERGYRFVRQELAPLGFPMHEVARVPSGPYGPLLLLELE